MNSKEIFINRISNAAIKNAVEFKIPASFTIAQAALESAWGSSKLALIGNNLFGVKADKSWTGEILQMPTVEFVNGKKIIVIAKWRKYQSFQNSLDDHCKFLIENKRYAKAFYSRDSEEFATQIALSGYATDPQYAFKIVSIIRSNALKHYDVA